MGFLTRGISPSEKTQRYWSFKMQTVWTKICLTMLMDWFSQLIHESSCGMSSSCYFWSTQLFSFQSKLPLMHSIPHLCSYLIFLLTHFSWQMLFLVSSQNRHCFHLSLMSKLWDHQYLAQSHLSLSSNLIVKLQIETFYVKLSCYCFPLFQVLLNLW